MISISNLIVANLILNSVLKRAMKIVSSLLISYRVISNNCALAYLINISNYIFSDDSSSEKNIPLNHQKFWDISNKDKAR